MVHSFFIIGLGFMLTLKVEEVEPIDSIFTSLIAGIEEMMLSYVFTGLPLLLYLFVLYLIFQRWYAGYPGKLH